MGGARQQRLRAELERFRSFLAARSSYRTFDTYPLDDWTVELRPKGGLGQLPTGKSVAITLLGVVHGNEVAGVAVLNSIVDMIVTFEFNLDFPVVLGIGNPWAAEEGQRFIERDLNRSFGREGGMALEERRARALEPLLKRTAFLLDVHQTTEHSDRPFFIFPFERRGFSFATAVAPEVSVVTHWGEAFSTEGRCSDEFVNLHGGVGITLELGQAGFSSYQLGFGTETALNAIKTAFAVLSGRQSLEVPASGLPRGEVYSWAAVLPYPKGKTVDLLPGWYNFKAVEKGQVLGSTEDGETITAPASGRILFPKYKKPQDATRPPTELCRIMTEIQLKDLP